MRSETILVVDDEPEVREYCQSVLTRAGYHVLQASGGEQALAICSEHRGTISLALVDVGMPGISGMELAKRLSRRMRIAMMSGYTPAEIKRLIGKSGANYHFFWKPFDTTTFLQTIRNLLDRSLPAHDAAGAGS
jgi:DNA-binding response OmpR family regulator